jgi:cytidyltransferase-like protein
MLRAESVVAIGEFDGFHLGHRDVVRAAGQLARATDRTAVAVVVAARDDTPWLRPTVTGDGRPLAEAHLLDFCDDLYGCRRRLDLMRRLRDEGKFPSVDALVDQIAGDVRATRDALTPRFI